jgi:pyridoxamine 5'-phosphate oxidase
MEKQQIVNVLNQPQPAYLATLEDGEPRVRGIQLYAADHRGILFQTGDMKAMAAQMQRHPQVEFCVLDTATNAQIRVRGRFEVCADMEIKKEIAEHPSRFYLVPMRQAMGDEAFFRMLTVFQMKKATAQVWTMETNLKPMPPVELFV